MFMKRDLSAHKAAIEQGLPTFTTGKPCRNAHDSPRYTRTGKCVQCQLDANDRYLQSHGRRRPGRGQHTIVLSDANRDAVLATLAAMGVAVRPA